MSYIYKILVNRDIINSMVSLTRVVDSATRPDAVPEATGLRSGNARAARPAAAELAARPPSGLGRDA